MSREYCLTHKYSKASNNISVRSNLLHRNFSRNRTSIHRSPNFSRPIKHRNTEIQMEERGVVSSRLKIETIFQAVELRSRSVSDKIRSTVKIALSKCVIGPRGRLTGPRRFYCAVIIRRRCERPIPDVRIKAGAAEVDGCQGNAYQLGHGTVSRRCRGTTTDRRKRERRRRKENNRGKKEGHT